MSAGDTIKCSGLDEALELHDELCRKGWDVEFEYQKGCAVILLLKGRTEE